VGQLTPRRERGFVLLDVLAALAIAMIGLAVFFGGLSGVTRLVARQGERVLQILAQRSSDAESQTVTFQGK
jgi:type II secretory pathway component PulJ